MEKRLAKQYKKFTQYFTERGMTESLRAMDLVNKYHVGERRGGGPERSHLYEVAGQTLAFLEGHYNTKELDLVVAASFLHDLVEDYSDMYPETQLRTDFFVETCNITMNVCKWKGFRKIPEDYDKYFGIIGTDIRSIFLKCSDRIHNLSTCIEGMSEKRIYQYIEETETYFYAMIKNARRGHPELYMALTAMKQQLEYRIKMIKLVLKGKDV